MLLEHVKQPVIEWQAPVRRGRPPLIAVAVALAALVRALVVYGYRPGFWYPDSAEYLRQMRLGEPGQIRPYGYSWFIDLFPGPTLLTVAQHALSLTAAVVVYFLLRRYALPAWGAVLAVTPLLFDVRQVQSAHSVLSDSLFQSCVLVAICLLLWKRRPSMLLAAASGGLLGLSTLVRPVLLPVLVLIVAWMVVRRAGLRTMSVFVAVALAPVAAYGLWFHSVHGRYAMTNSDGLFLWSRTMSFADCTRMDADLKALCPTPEEVARHQGFGYLTDGKLAGDYLFDADAWLWTGLTPGFTEENNARARRFAVQAIIARPGAFALIALRDVALTLLLSDPVFAGPGGAPFEGEPGLPNPAKIEISYYAYPSTEIAAPVAKAITAYRQIALPGVVFAGLLAAAAYGCWKRRGGPAALPLVVATGLLVLPCAMAQGEYRYALTSVPLACMAVALGVASGQLRTDARQLAMD